MAASSREPFFACLRRRTGTGLRVSALLIAALSTSGLAAAGLTLKDTLATAQRALSAGDYPAALNYFDQIEDDFGAEPEVRAASFQITVIPLHAYAALLSGHTARAIEYFETFLDRFSEDDSRQAFVLFNLARAYQKEGRPGKAIGTYRRFVAMDPTRPEAALATLSAAELMFTSGSSAEGFTALDRLIAEQPKGLIRNKARLAALQKAVDLGLEDKALRYLLAENWSVKDMPELAVLAFNALTMGQALVESGRYDEAIQCFRLVPPYPALLKAQRERLNHTKEAFASRVETVGLYQGGQFWTRFYRQLIGRLEQQLEALENAEDYSPSLYLSYGQAYLLADRPHEAWILFETTTREATLPRELQAEAHYRWILSAIEVGVWEDAFRIAEGFERRFPESPLVPDALFLLANAYQRSGQYRDAIGVLDLFLLRHPKHRLTPRARFVRGYNFNLLNEPAIARRDFERFTETYPDHGLYLDARFWRALTFSAEKNYTAALEALRDLQAEVRGHRLEAEVAYRIAATHYAIKDFETALEDIQKFLEEYPRHSRHEEGRVLLGDIEMGRGKLARARRIFASIQPSAGHLFAYAVFQNGKILRAVASAEDRMEQRAAMLDAHLEHFQHYANRDDITLRAKTRLSEALYWIGWTHIEQGAPERARDVFLRALNRYGDSIEADQVPDIIAALARTEKRLSKQGRSKHRDNLLNWLQAEKNTALKNERLTYFSRLNIYMSSLLPQEDREGLLFETVEKVPIKKLDPEALGRIAAALAENYPTVAEDYLRRLEEDYPSHRHRSYGYYARAILLIQEERYAEARNELARFRTEAPGHPLFLRGSLLFAETLTALSRYEEARETLEAMLRLRSAKGRPHAEALLALSRNAEAAGQLERAIPYAQRVYNVYRAYPTLAAEAYWISAQQFAAIDDPVAAYRTLEEMLSDPRLARLPIAEQATSQRDTLLDRIPAASLTKEKASAPKSETSTSTKEKVTR